MELILKKIKTNVIASALLCIALGIVLVIWPDMSIQITCMAIGIVLILNGISRLINFIFKRDGSLFSQMNLVMGIIITVIGIWIILQPEKVIAMIPILVGIIIIIHGVNNLQQAVNLCQSHYDKWWVALILGLLTIAFGILLICNPFGAIETLVMFIGLFLIYDGVSDIWIVSRMSRMGRQFKQEVEAIETDGREV
ncbi:MAG: DUF308 domain-containing protein [Ruminococcus sp.]|nr:DUF308 domain-containing protein [Ruminococcus sp.]MCM1155744.1 DUF308 domain-containing protein [Roseburia sp.]